MKYMYDCKICFIWVRSGLNRCQHSARIFAGVHDDVFLIFCIWFCC